MPVTETRESGIEILDTEVENISEDAEDHTLFRVEEPIEVQVSESAGNPVYVRADHFVVISVDMEAPEEMQMMTGEEWVDEVTFFISNEDGEIGGGFGTIEEVDLEEALEQFEEDYL